MPRPTVESARRRLAAPDPALDPFTRAQAEAAASAAYERGLADGAAAAAAAGERVAAAVAAAAERVVAELRAGRAAQAAADVDLAAALAEALLGREPDDGGKALLRRVREALAAVDDAPLRVWVHPSDEPFVAATVGGAEVSVHADPGLAPGEARVSGPWAEVDLTRAAAWQTLRAVLEAEGGAAPPPSGSSAGIGAGVGAAGEEGGRG